MTEIDDRLRALVRQTVREAVAELRLASTADAPLLAPAPGAEHVTAHSARRRTESVRISSDGDLDSFVRHVLALADNPRTREELRNGWLRFSLAGSPGPQPVLVTGIPAGPGSGPVSGALRVERGVVTERTVTDAASQGRSLLAAKGVVVTPLARDKARSLGVLIEKER